MVRQPLASEMQLHEPPAGTERVNGAALVPEVLRAFGDDVASVTVGRPTLEDVFLAKTGRSFE